MRELRKGTAATVLCGPFLDKTNALTPETALSSQTGRISKNGTCSAFTPDSWSHDADGYYLVGFDTDDIDTLGRMRVQWEDVNVYLPVWEDFMVVSQDYYDWKYGTAEVKTDVRKWLGSAVTKDGSNRPEVAAAAVADKTGYATTDGDKDGVAAKILNTPANKLWTNPSGKVFVVYNDDKANYGLSSAALASVADGVWDENITGHLITDTFGKMIYDILVDTAYMQPIVADVLATKLDTMIAFPNSDHYEFHAEALTSILALINTYYSTIYSMMEDGGGYYKFKDRALGYLDGLLLLNTWRANRQFKDDGTYVEDETVELYDSKANAEAHDGVTGLRKKVRNRYTWDSKYRMSTMLVTDEGT